MMNETFSKEAVSEKQAEAVATMTTLYTKCVARLADAQKMALDMTLQHNTDMVGAWKKMAKATPGTQVPSMVDLAMTTFGQFVDMQKGAIDLAVEQSQTMAGLASERFESVSKATDAVTNIMHDAMDRAAATQKNAIDFCAAQTKTVFDTFKKQPSVAGTPVEAATESMQHGFDTMVETQKEMLNMASKRPMAAKTRA